MPAEALDPKERVRRAHAKGYHVDQDGVPRNPNGDEMTGSRQNAWGISVWLDGKSRHVDVFQLSAYCHWDEEKWEQAMDEVETHAKLHIGPGNGDKFDASPENLTVKKRPRTGKLTWEDEDELVEDLKGGMSKNQASKKYGIDTSTILSIVDRRDDIEA